MLKIARQKNENDCQTLSNLHVINSEREFQDIWKSVKWKLKISHMYT